MPAAAREAILMKWIERLEQRGRSTLASEAWVSGVIWPLMAILAINYVIGTILFASLHLWLAATAGALVTSFLVAETWFARRRWRARDTSTTYRMRRGQILGAISLAIFAIALGLCSLFSLVG